MPQPLKEIPRGWTGEGRGQVSRDEAQDVGRGSMEKDLANPGVGCQQSADLGFPRGLSEEGPCQQLCKVVIPVFTTKETGAHTDGGVRGLPEVTGPEAAGAPSGG